MRLKIFIFFFFQIILLQSQNINVNNEYSYDLIRTLILDGKLESNLSLNIRPVNSILFDSLFIDQHKSIFQNKNKSIYAKTLGIDFFSEYNSHHPYNRNNGSMIPNKGYQQIISPGIFFRIGPVSIKFKPEHHFSENKFFDGFWNDHFPETWAKRYRLWNHIDMPERFGDKRHNKFLYGQSSFRINSKLISIGLSNENLWWGPSIRNSIMMSNHARGFPHLTFNTRAPVKSFLGSFEWQLITGRLENSGHTPPRTDYEFAGTKLYVPKINQRGNLNDWRYLQGLIISYSPKFIDGLSLGFIRWVQMYSALVEGKYPWLEGNPSYFPVFKNIFRKSDEFENYEQQTDQAAGLFFKWIWKDSKAEFYAEFYHNDSKQNFRDLLLDSDHSRASTFGLQKIFKIRNNKFLFNWEWTQMEQTGSRIVRNSGSWYEHTFVFDGFTNKGEVLGSSIGPGSNSHFFSLNRIRKDEKLGIGLEIIDQDNDFYYEAFSESNDFRRYWKDFNLHIKYHKKLNNFILSSNLVFIRSLNYQWELDNKIQPYYHPGKDVNNLHFNLKLTYLGNW